MNLLILQPTAKELFYTFLQLEDQKLFIDTRLNNFAGIASQADEWIDSLTQIKKHCQNVHYYQIDTIIIRLPFGGNVFKKPVIVNRSVITQLENLVPQSPLHLPGILRMIECCNSVIPHTPIILIFETSFFCGMPERESAYAISQDISNAMNLKRYGFNGIYHEAACLMVAREFRKQLKINAPRIISICLEPQPEIAAIKERRVLMVTSGATPLEGIPGQTTCGLIDPSIVFALAETAGWGPEKINMSLTKESGLLGLTGKSITLDELFTEENSDFILAREILQYSILSSCGAAIAAMGGLDAIVFSGRYVGLADILRPYLVKKLIPVLGKQSQRISFNSLREPRAVSMTNIASSLIVRFSTISPQLSEDI